MNNQDFNPPLTRYLSDDWSGQFTPENNRRQRELAALSRGEPLDDIHEIILRQVQRCNVEQVAFDQLAHDIRKALLRGGYKIVPT